MDREIPQAELLAAESDDDAIDLAAYLDFLIDYRWMIAGIALAVTLLGAAYAFIQAPIYQANILVQVEDSASSSKNLLGDLSSMFDLKAAATAEMEILRSRFVLSRAVEQTHLFIDAGPKYFPVLGQWIARHSKHLSTPGFLGYGGYVWGNEQISVPVFNVPEGLENVSFVLTATGADQFRLTQADAGIDISGKVGELIKKVVDDGTIELRVDRLAANSGAQFHLARAPALETVEKLQGLLAIVERGKQSGIINVTLEGADPTKTSGTLNAIGREYTRQNVERKSEEAEKSLAFLEKQLPDLKRSLEQAEVKYNALRNSRGTVDLGEEAKSVLQHSILAQTRMLELKQKRYELTARFQDSHPLVQALDQQIKTVVAELEGVNATIKKLPSTEQDVFRLTRDVKVNTDLYTALLNSAQQLRLIKASKVGNARLLDVAAKPLHPIRPKKATVIGLALPIGLFLGVLAAFLRRSLFGGIDDPHAIEARLGLTVSATIPHSAAQERLYTLIKSKAKKVSVLVHEVSGDPAVESLRSFRTSLQFSMLNAKNNIVMLTGPTPGVGKSFVSVNFAAILGTMGKRVLLIDGDLRKGYLHRYFGLERQGGLSEVVAATASLDDAIHRQVVDNVDFISTGDLPPHPAELLAHARFGQFLESVSALYDVVVIDTAPVLPVTDAMIIAPFAGSVFNIVRGGVSTLGEIDETVKRLRQGGIAVTGVVFNDLKPRAGRYGYGSKYGRYRYAQYEY